MMYFRSVDTDGSGALEADELQRALTNGDWSPFSLDTVRMMIGMFDRDNSGTIGFDEFVSLWKYIEDWKQIFWRFDADRSGSIANNELYNALQAFGFKITRQIVDAVVNKIKILEGAKRFRDIGGISFDRFIYSCVLIKNLDDTFKQKDQDRDGMIQLNLETFIILSLKN
ncbi:hypothetical protein BB558_006684 [Smittium angustum]|nr:hypothetical protein BB558_006684 [Smittium angustum]